MEFAQAIIKQAWKKPDEEICGFVIQRAENLLEAFEAENIFLDRKTNFEISAEDYIKATNLGNVVAIYHSHPYDPSEPSEADKIHSEELKIPYFIFSLVDKRFTAYVPNSMERAGIEGRIYVPLVYNCLTLCHDFYREKLGITLSPLRLEYRADSTMNENLRNYMEDNQFERRSEPEYGDIIVMNITNSVPDHTAIYLGNNEILHHCIGRRSERTTYGGMWKRATCYCLHHTSRK